jgi:hypothetical protein
MSGDLDDLLRPTISAEPLEPRKKPWRVQSQLWVAFFGGILAVTVIAIINARRLGIERQKRWLMATAGLIALGILFALWMRQPLADDFMAYARATRNFRFLGRFIAVALFLLLAWFQKRADAHHLVFATGDYASLWAAGVGASIGLGTLQSVAMAGLSWIIRQ